MTPLDPLAWSTDYHRRGWRLVSIPQGAKGPRCAGWQNLEIKADELPRYFGGGQNVGVILGPASGDLVDSDLDCPEALALADLYLPVTRAVFGRPSRGRSHRLYVAPGAVYEVFTDPLDGSVLLELRAQGRDGGQHQTVFPPSLHPSGERIAWVGDIVAPSVVDGLALRTAMAWLAIGCLVMRHVSETAARRPGPDLPRLLYEADPVLGRAAYRWLGLPDPAAPRRDPRPRRELSHDELDLAQLVHAIPNTCAWDEWCNTGMAIFAASKGSEQGKIVFDDWSAKHPKYNPDAVDERWRNFRSSPPSRIGIGTLIYHARAAGWQPKSRVPA